MVVVGLAPRLAPAARAGPAALPAGRALVRGAGLRLRREAARRRGDRSRRSARRPLSRPGRPVLWPLLPLFPSSFFLLLLPFRSRRRARRSGFRGRHVNRGTPSPSLASGSSPVLPGAPLAMKKFSRMPKSEGSGGGGGGTACGGSGSGVALGRTLAVGRYQVTPEEPLAEGKSGPGAARTGRSRALPAPRSRSPAASRLRGFGLCSFGRSLGQGLLRAFGVPRLSALGE